MDIGITIENPECCLCGRRHETRQDFAMIVCRQETLFFCPEHLDAVQNIFSSVKGIIESAEHKKIRHLRIKINQIKPQLKLLKMEA